MPQDQGTAIPWSQHIQQDAHGTNVGEEDFTKFLELDNGFEQFQQLGGGDGQSSLETPMGRLAFGSNGLQDIGVDGLDLMQNMDMSQFQPYQLYHSMGQPHQYQVPPTPVSAEMHAAKYGGHIDNAGQIIFDRHQASFTPLVSPAQIPIDNAFGIPDYMVSDDFFSPLTSPAIEAQHNYASTNATASPIDLNADHSAGNTPVATARKRSRKVNLSQQRPVRSVKQSPSMKPQPKRRQFSLTSIPDEKIENMLSFGEDRPQLDVNRPNNTCVSSEDSVSPEPNAEHLMRPPPVPSNAGRSPSALGGQSAQNGLPATPAMIMRMPGKTPDIGDQPAGQGFANDVMEDIELPDAAAAVPSETLDPIDTKQDMTDDSSTPTLSAKTPKLSANSTPRFSAIRSQNDSNESIDRSKRPESKIGGRAGKKRQTGPSAAISPALRPKISPSISPLAPTPGPGITTMSAETSALFLASKSNYQNILDGTHLPGVSYPETLAENLSSKRTSHKIAEQGRRNRINLALKEIESLLPASITATIKKERTSAGIKDADEGSPDKSSSAAQGASKASTVEMAIAYIKSLQAELKETQEELAKAQKTIADNNSSGSQTSE